MLTVSYLSLGRSTVNPLVLIKEKKAPWKRTGISILTVSFPFFCFEVISVSPQESKKGLTVRRSLHKRRKETDDRVSTH